MVRRENTNLVGFEVGMRISLESAEQGQIVEMLTKNTRSEDQRVICGKTMLRIT